jgi:hypothetical protein
MLRKKTFSRPHTDEYGDNKPLTAFFVSLSLSVHQDMALIMKYIDSMHHYMDKYGGK